MESFFRRMSSIVRKNSSKSSDADENESENSQDESSRQQHFRQMQQRRRSAPDIRRRTTPIEKTSLESDQIGTSFEQINTQNLTTQTSTNNLARKQYNSATTIASDEPTPSSLSSSSESRKTGVLITPPSSTSQTTIINTRSCTSSPRAVAKITTLIADSRDEISKTNYLSSDIHKPNIRRLSAPLLIQTSAYPHSQYPSTIVNEITEEALLSSLQRASFSSPIPTTTATTTYPNHSVHSLSANSGGGGGSGGGSSGCLLSRPENRSASFNLSTSPSSISNNLINNISSASVSGTPPTQFVVGLQSSSSPRVSIQSNNSPSHSSVMKDTSPTSETTNPDRKMSLPTRGRRPSMFDPIDPKELQQALYASAKVAVVPNPADEDDSHRAISHIKISYDRDGEHVFIESLSFENMQILDTFVNNNPMNNNNNNNISSSTNLNSSGNNHDFIPFYCRFRLYPEKRSLFQTKIVRYQRNQSSYLFDGNQLNDFELSFDQLTNHSIEILLYKVGTIKPSYKDIRIATIKYDLASLNEANQISLKKPLDECDSVSLIQDPDLGDLLVSLSYLQSAAKLAVVVLEAKNLRPLSIESKPYPEACVKVTLFDRNGKKLKRKKTSVQRASDCPTFNEELVFELRRDIAQEVMIELRIVHESLSYKEQLGSIIFGPAISNITTKGLINPENVYWSTILSGESLNAQWQILKTPIRIEESK